MAAYEESPADSYREPRWLVPMDGPLGSPFGPRWGRMHDGIDIEGWAETRVRATRVGLVTHVGWLEDGAGYGFVIKVRHDGRDRDDVRPPRTRLRQARGDRDARARSSAGRAAPAPARARTSTSRRGDTAS